MTLTTPALLFPAISLLLLAYTNRFLVLAQLIRQLHNQDRKYLSDQITRQIENLTQRMGLIRSMQAFGILSFLACTLAMFALFLGHVVVGEWIFGFSLILLMISLVISFWEIQISCVAINIELQDLRGGATGSDNRLTEA
jgi:Protein of unknown function (DUF2721)